MHRYGFNKLRNGKLRVILPGDEKRGDVESGDIHAVAIAMMVRAMKMFVVPGSKILGEHKPQFEVQVGAITIEASARVSHPADVLTDFEFLPQCDIRCGKMGIETVDGATLPGMLDDNVLSVVTIASRRVNIGYGACGDGTHFIEWSVVTVPFERFNIDALMKLGTEHPVFGASAIVPLRNPITLSFHIHHGFSCLTQLRTLRRFHYSKARQMQVQAKRL